MYTTIFGMFPVSKEFKFRPFCSGLNKYSFWNLAFLQRRIWSTEFRIHNTGAADTTIAWKKTMHLCMLTHLFIIPLPPPPTSFPSHILHYRRRERSHSRAECCVQCTPVHSPCHGVTVNTESQGWVWLFRPIFSVKHWLVGQELFTICYWVIHHQVVNCKPTLSPLFAAHCFNKSDVFRS